MENWVREIQDETIGGSPLKIGQRIQHIDGYEVEITKGQYMGTYGLSNFWYWQKVNEDGTLGEESNGYGYVRGNILYNDCMCGQC